MQKLVFETLYTQTYVNMYVYIIRIPIVKTISYVPVLILIRGYFIYSYLIVFFI